MYKYRRQRRPGSIAVYSLLLMVIIMAFAAFAVDMGYLLVSRTELQRSADASAVAAAWQLIDEGGWSGSPVTRATAGRYAGLNKIGRCSAGLGEGDVDIGQLESPSDPADQMTYSEPGRFNAVEVHVRRTASQNGEMPLFFARVLGYDSAATEAQATAAFLNNIRGFTVPGVPGHESLGILPIALDLETWEARMAEAMDEWQWCKENGGEAGDGEVRTGPDCKFEMNLFPQGTGCPGNRGTVDIGSNNNSTADIARQIIHGVSAADLAYHGGELIMSGEDYELLLNGDTGISNGVKDELESVIGQPRMIPIFDEVHSPGNNAIYTIVKWVGVRIMEVKLTGPMNKKRVIIQPAKYVTYGAEPADPGSPPLSDFVYSPAWIVR